MDDDRPLLLLHGAGADGGVWDGVRAALTWRGPILVPDLPGHGEAPPFGAASYGGLAAGVAEWVHARDGLDGAPLVVVGHSLGGVVGLVLASGWFGIDVARVIGVGIKTTWEPGEAYGPFREPALPTMVAAATCPITLVRGERDPMNTHEENAALVADARTLPGLGHNLHVKAPGAVVELLA